MAANRLVRGVLVTFVVAVLLPLLPAEVRPTEPTTAPSGDLNQDGTLDVVDIQCEVLLFTQAILNYPCVTDQECIAEFGANYLCAAGFGGAKICLPVCKHAAVSLGTSAALTCNNPAANDADCLGLVQKRNADMNCDQKLTNVDFQFLVQVLTEKTGGPMTADYDDDGRLNFCDDDSDADGDPDATDCGKLDPTVHSKLPELCDGHDNDCDGLADGADPSLSGPACEVQTGVCQGIAKGPALCKQAQWLACTSVDYEAGSPDYEASELSCDGLDNDCDGFVDGDDPLFPTPLCENQAGVCAGSHKGGALCDGVGWKACSEADYAAHSLSYQAAESLCDGLDNDCDGTADDPWPGLGKPCDSTDSDLCLNGELACAANHLGAVCDEFPDGLEEVCANEADDDCDGAIDESSVEDPCQPYKPPIVGARVFFSSTQGHSLGTADKGAGYYEAPFFDLTDQTLGASVQAKTGTVAAAALAASVVSGNAASIELLMSRGEVYSDDPVAHLLAFVTDSSGRPVSGLADVKANVTGPFGSSSIALTSNGNGIYLGNYTPAAGSFATGGTVTLKGKTGIIESVVGTVFVTPLPEPPALVLDGGQVGLDLPLGPRLAGSQLDVPLRVDTGGQTLASLQFEVQYPANLVSFVEFKKISTALNPPSILDDAGQGTVTMATTRDVQSDPLLLTGSVLLGYLRFQVKAAAPDGGTGQLSGTILELLDTSGNAIASSPQMIVHDGSGQGSTGIFTAEAVAVRGMAAWIDDLDLVDISALGVAAEKGTVHAVLFKSDSASPQASSPSCVCANPIVCSCANGLVSVAGAGQSGVTLAAGGFQRQLTVNAHKFSSLNLALADAQLQAIQGWTGHFQAASYTAKALVAGPAGNTTIDATKLVTLASSAPAIADWDKDRLQVAGKAAGVAMISALGGQGQVLATAQVTVLATSVAPSSLEVVVPALVEMQKVSPSPVPAVPGTALARARLAAFFKADGQSSPWFVFLKCADGYSHEITTAADLVLTTQSGGTVTKVSGTSVLAAGSGSDVVSAQLKPGGGAAIASGQAEVEVALPDADGASFSPASAKLARSAQDAAATIKGLSTSADLHVTVHYVDGTSKDMTADVRTQLAVTQGAILIKVCDAGDADPGCPPGRVVSLGAGTGSATVTATWPGLYPLTIKATATIEVVGHAGLALSTLEDFDPPAAAETVLSFIEGSTVRQKARVKLVEQYSDGSSQDVTSHASTTYSLTNQAGQPEVGVLALAGGKLSAVGPGLCNVQGLLAGNQSNKVLMTVEGPGVVDGDGKTYADVTELRLKQPADLVGLPGKTLSLDVEATFNDGTKAVLVSGGQAVVAGLIEFTAGNANVCNPADPLYASVHGSTGLVTLAGNGLVRVVASLKASLDLSPAYAPGAPPNITQANPLQLPTSHPGTRWIKCNKTAAEGDADLGSATGLAVPPVIDPGQTFELLVRLNSGANPLGAFSVEVAYPSNLFEVPQPASQYLDVLIPADAAAINDPAPGIVKVTVVPTQGSGLVGTTDVAKITLKGKNTKQGAPVFGQIGGTVLEMFANCPDPICPAINGALGPAPRAIQAGVVSLDPAGNLADKGDFNGDGQFGAADLQAVVNYVVDPDSLAFAALDKDAANIYPDALGDGNPKVQAFDAYVGALISVGLSHFVELTHSAAGGQLVLTVEVRDGSAQPAPVTSQLAVRFEIGLMSGASVAGALPCGAGCSASKDADGNPIPARQLYAAAHQGNGLYKASIPGWQGLPAGDTAGIVVILQNLNADGTDKGAPTVYLKSPYENLDSPFEPLLRVSLCDVEGQCQPGNTCASGACVPKAGEGSPCTLDSECAAGFHCNETALACEADKVVGEACNVASDCVDTAACFDGKCAHVLCEVSGSKGQVAGCQLHLARAAAADLPATMLELRLAYVESDLTPDSMTTCGPLEAPFTGFPCPDGTECAAFGDSDIYCNPDNDQCEKCTAWELTDTEAVLPTGHMISTCSQPPKDTCTSGRYRFLFAGTESLPITAAYLDGNGVVQGESLFLTFNLLLDKDLPSPTAVAVLPADFKATDKFAGALAVTVGHSSAPNPTHYILTAGSLD